MKAKTGAETLLARTFQHYFGFYNCQRWDYIRLCNAGQETAQASQSGGIEAENDYYYHIRNRSLKYFNGMIR